MKKVIMIAGLTVLLAGCGRGKNEPISAQQIMKLESEIQMLKQSVEMQGKALKTLASETAQLKVQLAETGMGAKSIEGLKSRVEMLEADAGEFAK